jgi:hypothetical protein
MESFYKGSDEKQLSVISCQLRTCREDVNERKSAREKGSYRVRDFDTGVGLEGW